MNYTMDAEQILAELDARAPGVPFLALGQTVFWDEPMKAGVVAMFREKGDTRRFTAGVHDTDYFAKLPSPDHQKGFKALPHNDTTTKNIWSAAGEFSSLFGSETVITKEILTRHGGKLARIEAERPGFLDEITEAYGWRGVVSLSHDSKTTMERSLDEIFPELFETFRWAVEESLKLVSGGCLVNSEDRGQALLKMVCDIGSAGHKTLADFFEALLKPMFHEVQCSKIDLETTRTSKLLRLSQENISQPRFEIVNLFLQDKTREAAIEAYNNCLTGSEIYTLDRFGTGAIPFDLIIPGVGRGTLKLGSRGGVVMTPHPVGFSYKKRPQSVEELLPILEKRFGTEVILIGKAITFVMMLAKEFVFLFHEGASSYVSRSAQMARELKGKGHDLNLNPILRICYEPWDGMSDCCAWLNLPEDFRRPFGTDQLSAESFAARWREVAKRQKKVLADLAEIRRPIHLVKYLQESVGGQWTCLAEMHEATHEELERLHDDLAKIKGDKAAILAKIKDLKKAINEMYHAKGKHWRDKIFQKNPTESDLQDRQKFEDRIATLNYELREQIHAFKELAAKQDQLVSSDELSKVHRLRSNIALEAEMMRVSLIREAIVTTDGLKKAGHRPSAWWFNLICPDGAWFRSTMSSTRFAIQELG